MTKPLLAAVNHEYFNQWLDWKNISYQMVGDIFKVDRFAEFNYLVYINSIFSTKPSGVPVDRTQTVRSPLNFRVARSWQVPTKNLSLDQAFSARVEHYLSLDQPINLFWSGGSDSSAMVAAFLKHSPGIDRLRLIYSPHSIYENKKFFDHVTRCYPKLFTQDISGDFYVTHELDGAIVTGHGGDEYTSSLDKSFFDTVGALGLQQSWQDYFYQQTHDDSLINFCEEYFALAGRPIRTVLEARWWFYLATKTQAIIPRDSSFIDQADRIKRFSGFFDCEEFESFIWHNTDQIVVPGQDYTSYKKFLRHYVYEFNGDIDFLENTEKKNSLQFQYYRQKKIELNDLRWICILDDGTVIRTKNLPLLSKKEFDSAYGTSLDYLFNSPD